jgi:hypothetical protein
VLREKKLAGSVITLQSNDIAIVVEEGAFLVISDSIRCKPDPPKDPIRVVRVKLKAISQQLVGSVKDCVRNP